MVYGSSSVIGDDDGGDSDTGGSDWLLESTDPILDLLPNSYSDSNVFLYKS